MPDKSPRSVDHRHHLFSDLEKINELLLKENGELKYDPNRLIDVYLRTLFTDQNNWQKFQKTENYRAIKEDLVGLITQLLEEYNDTQTNEEKNNILKQVLYTIIFLAYVRNNGAGENNESAYNFTKRNPDTNALLPHYDYIAFSQAIEEYEKHNLLLFSIKDKNQRKKAIKIFTRIYIQELKERFENLSKAIPEKPIRPKGGYWYVVGEKVNTPAELKQLRQILKKHSIHTPAGWCTGRGHDITYTSKGNVMYILHGVVDQGEVLFDGEQTVAYAAIRINDEKVVEVRGRLIGQNMSAGAKELVIKKLEELKKQGIEGTEEYINRLKGLTEWFELEKRLGVPKGDGGYIPKKGEELEEAARILLLELIDGVEQNKEDKIRMLEYLIGTKKPPYTGYKLDAYVRNQALTAISKIFNSKDVPQKWLKIIQRLPKLLWKLYYGKGTPWRKKDMFFITKYNKLSITNKTKVIIGNYKHRAKHNLSGVECVIGNFHFKNFTIGTILASLRYIGGDADFYSLTFAEGLESLEYIGGNADFYNLTSAKDLGALKYIGGDADFSNLENAYTLPNNFRFKPGTYVRLKDTEQNKRYAKEKYGEKPSVHFVFVSLARDLLKFK